MTVVDAALPGGTLPLPMRAIGDTVTLTGRSLRHVLRSPDTIITSAIIPIALMLLFVYVFGGAIDPDHAAYVTYQLPGILLITPPTVCSWISVTGSSTDSGPCPSPAPPCSGPMCSRRWWRT
jgi:hypothetical protein